MSTLRIAEAYWKRAIATLCVATVFVLLYEIQTRDSKSEASVPTVSEMTVLPQAGARMQFSATAYCKGLETASGVAAQSGIVAADPQLLPVGSVVEVDSLPARYNGIYTVLDTGPSVQGRQVDIYMWSCNEALQFGRRPIHLNVVRLGWNPRATTPSLLERMLKKPGPEPLNARPLPQSPQL